MLLGKVFADEWEPLNHRLVCGRGLERGSAPSFIRCSVWVPGPSASCPSNVKSLPPPDNTTLVPLVPLHVEVAIVCDGKDMWRQLTHVAVVVQLYLLPGIEGQHLEWVHGYQDGTCVCLGKGAGN